MYRLIHKGAPRFVWVDSPATAVLAIWLLAREADTSLQAALRVSLTDSLWGSLGRSLWDSLRRSLGRSPRAEDEPLPAPVFSHHAYDVDVTWLGENGGMAARGHIPDLRFIAACNHLARTEAGLLNIFDDRSIRLDDAIAQINRIWAVPIDPAGSGSDWAIRWGDVTGHTPGAFPLTVMLP